LRGGGEYSSLFEKRISSEGPWRIDGAGEEGGNSVQKEGEKAFILIRERGSGPAQRNE